MDNQFTNKDKKFEITKLNNKTNRKSVIYFFIPILVLIMIFSQLSFAAKAKSTIVDEVGLFEAEEIGKLDKSNKAFFNNVKCDMVIYVGEKEVDADEKCKELEKKLGLTKNWLIFIINDEKSVVDLYASDAMLEFFSEDEVETTLDFLLKRHETETFADSYMIIQDVLVSWFLDYPEYMEANKIKPTTSTATTKDEPKKDEPKKPVEKDLVYKVSNTQKVVDITGTLTPEEIKKISDVYAKFIDKNKCDLAFVIINDNKSGMSSQKYAETFYKQNNYGLGDNKDGVMCLVDLTINEPGKRRIEIIRQGYARPVIDKFHEDVMDSIFESVKKLDFANVALKFEKGCQKSLSKLNMDNGKGAASKLSYDEIYALKVPFFTRVIEQLLDFYPLAIGAVIAGIVVLVMISKHKGEILVTSSTYAADGSFALQSQRDTFIRTEVSKSSRKKSSSSDSSSSSSSGGGGGGRSF